MTGLSPFITHGVLTLPQVYDDLVQHVQLTPGHKLVYELGWREYFRHVWAHRGEGIFESLHDGPLPESAYARELPSDLRAACTGVPVIDQAVRTLYATGY
ncbi:MAG: deoxyribodipyrimidine photolyase, partial [Betaproteobacteria bacterium]